MVQPTNKRLVTEARADAVTAAEINRADSETKAALSATYAGKARVPVAPLATAPGTYDVTRHVYNLKAKHLRKARAKLSKAKAGTDIARIGFFGDSTVAGYAGTGTVGVTDWPGKLLKRLTQKGHVSTGTGPVGAYKGSGGGDPRWSLGSGWNAASGNGTMVVNTTTTNAATFTSTTTGTVARLYYANNSAAFTVSIDGAAAVTVTPAGNSTIAKYEVAGLANTTHTIAVNRISGTAQFLAAEVANSGTSGVSFLNAGIGGGKISMGTAAEFWAVAQFLAGNTLAQFNADLIFLMCETNDANGAVTPPATYKTNAQTTIDKLKVNGADLVLMTAVSSSGIDFTAYNQALYELADSNDLPLIDLQDAWGAYADMNTLGMMFDGIHPSISGYEEISRVVERILEA